LASQASFEKYGRKSRRELFLDEMEMVGGFKAEAQQVRVYWRIATSI